MLPLALVQEIQQLLDEGQLSQRKIALRLNVSRGTVGAIASGRRGIYGREPNDNQPLLCCLELPPERCPSCGGKVYKPCVLCRAREYRARQERLLRTPPRRVA